jgi:predicted Zn-dependent protease
MGPEMTKHRAFLVAFVCATAVLMIPSVDATTGHSAGYHWAGTGERAITVIDSVKVGWDPALTAAVTNWNVSNFIDMTVTPGSLTKRSRKRCTPTLNSIHVCNYAYGRTGWAGLAKVFFDQNFHIVKANARLNATYVRSASKMQAVACHEIGHALGLGHRPQPEGATSCLSPILSTSSVPDGDDYTELTTIYNHSPKMAEAVYSDGPYTVVTIKVAAP